MKMSAAGAVVTAVVTKELGEAGVSISRQTKKLLFVFTSNPLGPQVCSALPLASPPLSALLAAAVAAGVGEAGISISRQTKFAFT